MVTHPGKLRQQIPKEMRGARGAPPVFHFFFAAGGTTGRKPVAGTLDAGFD